MSKQTILIADDQPLIRDGIAAILNMEDNYTVVAKTGDGLATIAQVQLHRPQLVLMDIHMPKMNGLEATKQIKSEFPDIKVLILTTFEEEEYIWEAIRHGASGFLVKGVETEKMLSTIQDCLDGRINYPFSIQLRLAQVLQSSEQHQKQSSNETNTLLSSDPQYDDKLKDLSVQERNIVKNLKQGKSNQAIASELFLTTGTVKNYLSVIYKKLNVSSRSEALAYLHENDL
ncbi:DNA-binding response regulator, NarL/FixJ family, contains REC and HTH domains [Paenibacillus sp. 1_12]|uniref:response regulator transcription factor n=1 Tax=Paenibacillus sp. 1_12 TaxID=1566278 RepID=UPI0008E44E15|nr:response regulator transcription factor [Paenibacillus sp. 1_12]SFK67013.1 DNA-binding response regulator, NarL/FixJ family, contains REC and HTH domains [Paenibacillus sp. 1_12]